MLGKAALLFFTTAFAAAAPAYPSADESFEIYLKSRTFTFPEKHDEDLCCENAANAERIRVFLQPRGVPNVETRSTLEKRGIRLLDYVPNNRWFASVPAGLHVNSRVLQTIRWAGAILPGDKIAPSLREMEASGSSRTNDGRIYAVVKYFEDVDKEEIKKLVLKLDASLIGEIPETESFTISLPKGKIPDLVEDDGT